MAALTPRARAQDAATQQQLDKITGEIQDVQDSLSAQGKRLDDLEDKLNTPAVNNSASADDLKKLAEQVQEIDKKRQEDNEEILKTLEKLGKGGDLRSRSSGSEPSAINPPPTPPNATPISTAGGPQNGYDYVIAPNNTLSAIAKAYQAKGVKVTVAQILAANPGLKPNSLIVGQKIFIPAPQ
jgi:LysM repeat protein